ncbi:MAG: type II toxin-antitoxin system VapC family toxin [Proteobacteria bacterium]|nr:type II toxin-antitoxin system VapC family toxin [Pseudomonadota bacterium]
MTARPLRAVVDASVAVKLFVPENLSAEAHSLFATFASNPQAELFVPGLFFIECANVFWKWRRHGYPASAAAGHLDDLRRLDLTVIPTQALAAPALHIAFEHDVTTYDACYVAAAAQLGAPFLTADRKLVAALASTQFDIRWLAQAIP